MATRGRLVATSSTGGAARRPVFAKEVRHAGPVSTHSDFWVVAGTAAPVLGLSAIVAIGATLQASLKLQEAAELGPGEPAEALVSAQLLVLRLPYVASIISASIDILVLSWALVALAHDSDPVSPTLATVLLVVSFVLLWLQVYFVAAISFTPRSKAFVETALRRGRRKKVLRGKVALSSTLSSAPSVRRPWW